MTRKDTILKLIVEHFIKTAEPVGSMTLLETYGLECSSATIRAEMSALEKDGYLEKTHTSSGRVPSKKGYEYYVENLRDDRVDGTFKHALQTVLDRKAQSVEEVIKQSCEILSNMTNLASVVLGPKVTEEHLVSVQIIPIGPSTATAVFVTDQGYVENKTFLLPDAVDLTDVQKTVGFLNDRLKGTSINDLVPKMESMKVAVTDYMVGEDLIYQALLEAILKFASERMNLYGKANLLDHPEFAEDAKKMRKLLQLLDNPKALRSALEESQPADEESPVTIHIGEGEAFQDVSIVSANLMVPGGQTASISLLGPTRMDYEKATSMLEYVSKALEEYFSGAEGESKQCQKTKKESPSKKPRKK